MSDVLIKGMKMPKGCNECRFHDGSWCCAQPIKNWRDSYYRPPEGEKQPTCPLVEVPSDVRLINAYSLAVKVAEAQDKLKGQEYDPFMLLGDVLRWIGLEPTIIAANTSTDRFCNTEGCSNSKPDMSKAQNHICPYYQGVCSLDENILCYCEHHYEMCDKFIKVIKGRK